MFYIFPSQCAPTGSAEQPYTATQKGHPHHLDVQITTLVPIRLLAHIHVCSNVPHKIHTTQFGLHPPVTSTKVGEHLDTPQQWH